MIDMQRLITMKSMKFLKETPQDREHGSRAYLYFMSFMFFMINALGWQLSTRSKDLRIEQARRH